MAPKQQQKKKQKTTEGSSSGAQARNLLSSQQYAKERKKRLVKMNFMNSQYLDWSILEEYGMKDTIQNLVQDKTWFKVFDMREPAYKNLTIEFLSTLTLDEDGDENTITFQVFGEVRSVALKRIGVLMGYYDDESQNYELPNGWPKDMDAEVYWARLIYPEPDPFIPSKSLNNIFQSTEHKLLHHLIAHTLSCRKSSHSKVTTFDMFYLYSLITGYRVDLGVEVANFLWRQADDTRTKLIFCGGYITKLLKGMGIFQDPVGDDQIVSKHISSAPFRSWGLVKVPRRNQQG